MSDGLTVLVKIGASHTELLADLEKYPPRARAGRMRNLALSALVGQAHPPAEAVIQSTGPRSESLPQTPPPPTPKGEGGNDARSSTKAALKSSLGYDDD